MGILKNYFFAVMVVLVAPATAFSQQNEDSIKNLLVERDQEIKTLLGPEGQDYSDEQRAELKEIINGIIDFEAMAETALDDTYNSISEESRQEFITLFTTIIRDHSLNKLEIYRASVTYNTIALEGDKALIKTYAELEEVRTPVEYKMGLLDNTWFITDMSVDDVWTAQSYKNQFQRIIARKGFDALMERLRKRAANAN